MGSEMCIRDRTRTFGLPVRFDGQTTALRLRPPALGEHNDEVLGALRAARKGVTA